MKSEKWRGLENICVSTQKIRARQLKDGVENGNIEGEVKYLPRSLAQQWGLAWIGDVTIVEWRNLTQLVHFLGLWGLRCGG